MTSSRLDAMYRKLFLTKMFRNGWGSPDALIKLYEFRKVITDRSVCRQLLEYDYPIHLTKTVVLPECKIIEGHFRTPFAKFLENVVPDEVQTAYFQMVLPLEWKLDGSSKPICLHLASTGDHYFWGRRNIMAKPLLRNGIGAIILENPFYGLRKPKNQNRSCLRNVSDILVMGGCLMMESVILMNWCERSGYGPLGVSGISLGGHMASLAASMWRKPLVLVPCLSWSTAASVFTEGVISGSIDWDLLQQSYHSNAAYADFLSKHCQIVDGPYLHEQQTSDSNQQLPVKRWNFVTPYEILTCLRSPNCPVITYQADISKIQGSTASANKRRRKTSLHADSIDMDQQQVMNSKNDAPRNGLGYHLLERLPYISLPIMEESVEPDVRIRYPEAFWFMRGILDEFTHLHNFPIPFRPELVTAVCAQCDGYVPRLSVSKLEDIWPGITVKYLETGHVGAYLYYRDTFRKSIVETFEKAARL